MKYSKAPYATVMTLVTYCYEHQQDEPWLVIGFIVNEEKETAEKKKQFLEYLWERGFEDNLCLKI